MMSLYYATSHKSVLVVMLLITAAVQAKDPKALKKPKNYKGYDKDRVTRAHLLWDLILTRNKLRLKRNSKHPPLQKSMRVYTIPLKLGLCKDQHPLCWSYALNGVCDTPGLFQDQINIQQKCAFSCGYCKKNIPDGEVELVGDSWDAP